MSHNPLAHNKVPKWVLIWFLLVVLVFLLSCFHLLKVEPKFSSFSLKLKMKGMVNFFSSTQTEIYKWFEQEADERRKKQEEKALWNFFHRYKYLIQISQNEKYPHSLSGFAGLEDTASVTAVRALEKQKLLLHNRKLIYISSKLVFSYLHADHLSPENRLYLG